MPTEIEAKWLRIDHAAMRATLQKVGARLVHPERLMRRKNFDFPRGTLQAHKGWVRVRDEGDKITLSYKQLNDRSVHGTKEICVTVDNFEQSCDFLVAIGLRHYSFQETKRESWKLGNAEIELDTWPWIPPFIEIEAPSEQELRAAAEQLGLPWDKALHGSVEVAFQDVYQATDKEVTSQAEITFDGVAPWPKKEM